MSETRYIEKPEQYTVLSRVRSIVLFMKESDSRTTEKRQWEKKRF